MTHYDLIVIGFGKAGKTLAGKMSVLGKKWLSLRKTKICSGELVSMSVVFQPKPC